MIFIIISYIELSSAPWSFEITISSELDDLNGIMYNHTFSHLSLSFSSVAQCVVQFDLPEQYPDQPPLFTLVSVTPPSIPSQTILDLLEEQVGVTSLVLEIFYFSFFLQISWTI